MLSRSLSAGFSWSRATIDSTPVVLTMAKSSESVPDLVQVTVPRWPVTVGVGPVQAAFSAAVALAKPLMVIVSATSVTVSVTARVAVRGFWPGSEATTLKL